MSRQPSCFKTRLTQPLSLWLLMIAVLTLLPGMRGARAIATNPNPLRSSVGLPQKIAQSSDARKAEADRLLQQGIEQSQRIEFDKALQSWQQALAIYRQLQDRVGEVNALDKLGTASMKIEKYPEAIGYFQQELAIAQEIKDRSAEERARYGMKKAEADRLYRQGVNKSGRGDVKEALQSWQQALAIYREIQDHTGELNTLDNLGTTSMHPTTPEQLAIATNYFRQELVLAQKIKDTSNEERGRYWLEAVNRIQNSETYKNPPVALPQQIAQSSDARKAEADRLLQQAIEERSQPSNSFYRVIPPIEAALRLYREIKDQKGEMNALINLGIAYETFEQYAKAIDHYQQGLTIAREIKDRKIETDTLNSLGYVYTVGYPRDYQQAIDYEKQGLAIAREIKYRMGEVDALNRLGIVYKAQENYQQAINYYQQSLAITREIKDQEGEVMVLGNLVLAYKAQGNYQQAKYYEEQRSAIGREPKERQIEAELSSDVQHCRESGDRYCEMTALGSAGDDYANLHDYPKAIEFLQQALAIAREVGNRPQQEYYLTMLASAYSSLNNYPKAIENLQILLASYREINDTAKEAGILILLSEAYRAFGKDATADEYYRLGNWLSSERLFRNVRMVLAGSRSIDVLAGRALNLFKSGKVAEAEKRLLDAIQLYESSVRKTTSNEDYNKLPYYYGDYHVLKLYYTLQQILIAQNKIEPALEIAERGRAKAFAELLAKRIQSTEQPTIQPIQITAIKQVAREQNATLVEYSQLNDEQLFIWVVKPNGEVAFRKVDLKPLKQQNTTLAELVFNSRDSIGVRGLPIIGVVPRPGTQQKQEANLTEQLQQLHKLLIAPISDLLPADPNAHVIFVPQGSLFLAPFAALQDPRGKYLIEQHTIVIAPSIRVLELTHKQRQQVQQVGRQQALVVGNPIMPLQLPQLPGAEQEAKAIAALLHTQAIIGTQATKKVIVQQMPNARWIHLATHGILDDQQGLASAIALAPNGTGEKTDGLLTADEILNLKLNAELVVLSACDTGRGRITGDGVIGLSRSLITAGVPSVLVSLWAVPDAPTASLMQGFYQQLQSNPDKAQALRQTMLSTMKQHPNPRDWAAFMLIGEAR